MADTKAKKTAESKDTEPREPQAGDLPEVAEGESVDGSTRPQREQTDGHVEPSTSGAGDVGLATHDAHGGTDQLGDTTLDIPAAAIVAGVPPEQTEASLREHHTADALEPGTNAELVPGFEARTHGHGPDAQHRFKIHARDADDAEHNFMTANMPAEVCAGCGSVRLATT